MTTMSLPLSSSVQFSLVSIYEKEHSDFINRMEMLMELNSHSIKYPKIVTLSDDCESPSIEFYCSYFNSQGEPVYKTQLKDHSVMLMPEFYTELAAEKISQVYEKQGISVYVWDFQDYFQTRINKRLETTRKLFKDVGMAL